MSNYPVTIVYVSLPNVILIKAPLRESAKVEVDIKEGMASYRNNFSANYLINLGWNKFSKPRHQRTMPGNLYIISFIQNAAGSISSRSIGSLLVMGLMQG